MEFFLTTLVVSDYDEAIDYYCNRLGFSLLEDTPLPDGKRWVVVKPAGADASGAALLLAKAATPAQAAAVGAQTGGRVGFFLHTDDFDETYARFLKPASSSARRRAQSPTARSWCSKTSTAINGTLSSARKRGRQLLMNKLDKA